MSNRTRDDFESITVLKAHNIKRKLDTLAKLLSSPEGNHVVFKYQALQIAVDEAIKKRINTEDTF